MFTVTDCVTGVPAAVWQVIVYVAWPVTTTGAEPVFAEDERLGPDTAQLVTSVEAQEIIEVLPDCTRTGAAEIVAVGCTTVTVVYAGAEVPFAPEHVTP